MNPRPFLDTNILIYAYSFDDLRCEPATELIEKGGFVSVQVLNEFVDVARRKLRFDWDRVSVALVDLGRLLEPPLPLTTAIHRDGLEIARRHGLRIYDSSIVAAARLAGCSILYSEDMQAGQVIADVTIINPFQPTQKPPRGRQTR